MGKDCVKQTSETHVYETSNVQEQNPGLQISGVSLLEDKEKIWT